MPKLIPVSGNNLAIVDDADAEELGLHSWRFLNGYAYREESNGGILYMHQHLLECSSVDHKNGNGLDNRRSNLRQCTQAQNCANSIRIKEGVGGLVARKVRLASSKYRGVSWRSDRQRWTAYVGTAKKRKVLGCFDSEKEAAEAYNTAAVEMYGEFAKLNQTT